MAKAEADLNGIKNDPFRGRYMVPMDGFEPSTYGL
jgi:hypothetical protein